MRFFNTSVSLTFSSPTIKLKISENFYGLQRCMEKSIVKKISIINFFLETTHNHSCHFIARAPWRSPSPNDHLGGIFGLPRGHEGRGRMPGGIYRPHIRAFVPRPRATCRHLNRFFVQELLRPKHTYISFNVHCIPIAHRCTFVMNIFPHALLL